MVESFIQNRIVFNKKGTQKRYISLAKEQLQLTWDSFAKKLGISTRTLTSWGNEKLHMSETAAKTIMQLTDMPIPRPYSIIEWNNHLKNISKKGGRNSFLKHGNIGGDVVHRKNKWREWWDKTGQYKNPGKGYQSLIEINKPEKSKLLAEFTGIMLGDGGVTSYSTSVTLSNTEKSYILYVCNVISNLFGLLPKVYKHSSAEAVRIIVNRKELVDFCQSIGLVKGDKIQHQIDIPDWIKENKVYARECIRGLVDTDGCFYTNSYLSHGKKYSYFKIAFVSASVPLIMSFTQTLTKMGIKARISKNFRDVRIEEEIYVRKYIDEIGSHNQKHIDKIVRWEMKKK